MNGGRTESGTRKEALPSQTIIEFIMEVAMQLRNWEIPDQQAIAIAQTIIDDFAKRYRGEPFYFNYKKDCTGKVFLESVLTENLQRHGFAVKEAAGISAAVIDKLFLQYANLSIYIPFKQKDGIDRIARDKAIIAAYRRVPTTDTIRRLSAKYDICRRRIYKIIKDKTGSAPKKRRNPKAERNAAIVAAYKKEPSPATIKRLADEHRLEVGTVYGILWNAKR